MTTLGEIPDDPPEVRKARADAVLARMALIDLVQAGSDRDTGDEDDSHARPFAELVRWQCGDRQAPLRRGVRR